MPGAKRSPAGADVPSRALLGARGAGLGSPAAGACGLGRGAPPPVPNWYRLDVLLGLRKALPVYVQQAVEALAVALGLLLLVMLARLLLRHELSAAAVVVLVLSVQVALGDFEAAWRALPLFVLAWSVPVGILLRVGLLAHVACMLVLTLLLNHPLTLDIGHWTATPTFLAFAVLGALVFYGFHVARAGRPLFADELP